MKVDDLCTYHRDGWHRTLLATIDLPHQDPDPRYPGRIPVVHTCACWVPKPGHSGKIQFDTYEGESRFRWQGNNLIPLLF